MKKEFFKKVLVIFLIMLLNANTLVFATGEIVGNVVQNNDEISTDGSGESDDVDNSNNEDNQEITEVYFENESEDLFVGDEINLNLIIVPDVYEGKIQWESDDTEVATVDESGKVIATSEGTAVITATIENGLSAEVTINVKEETKITLSSTSISLKKGSTKTLSVNFDPEENKEDVTWSSSNTKVAKVDSNGKITAVSKGTATITAKTESGTELTCKVTVTEVASTKISLGYTHKAKTTANLNMRKSASTSSSKVYTIPKGKSVTITSKTNSKWYKVEYKSGSKTYKGYVSTSYIKETTNLTLPVGHVRTLKATVTPSNTTDTIKWTSSKSSVVSVNQNGKLFFNKTGTAIITATTSSGKSDYAVVSCIAGRPAKSVAIKQLNVYTKLGKTVSLTKTTSPSNTTDKLTWTSSDPSVAKVDSNGKVTPLKAGKTVITLKSTSGKKDSCNFYVTGVKAAFSLNYKAAYYAEKYDNCYRIVYGKSTNGNPLEAYVITGTGKNNKTLFIDFAVHGYEDEYAKDGKVLVDKANHLVQYYCENPEKLGNYNIVIVPAANPDGVLSGKNNYRAGTKGAYGRCTAKGIDMNRDFGKNGFKAVESRALRDVMKKYDPDIYLNVHGWENSVIGDKDLVNIVRSKVGLKTDKSGRYGEQYGYIIAYAKNTLKAKAALIEFKDTKSASDVKLRNALNMIMDVY